MGTLAHCVSKLVPLAALHDVGHALMRWHSGRQGGGRGLTCEGAHGLVAALAQLCLAPRPRQPT